MMKTIILASMLLLLAACAATVPQSACNAPPPLGETSACVYYPGYGWAHPPVYRGAAPGATF